MLRGLNFHTLVMKRHFVELVKKFPLSEATKHITRNMSTKTSKSSLDIGGIYPPIVTPFDRDENIDYERLEHNMKLWNKADLTGYVVLGSNGEAGYLTMEERVGLVARVRQLAGRQKKIIAGSGCESTRETISLTCRMAEAGADAAMVVTPCFYKGQMTREAMIKHYTRVADESPIPVILYSVPNNTTIDLSPEVIEQLSRHPNIIGLKDSGGDVAKIGNLVYKTKEQDFQILAGSAGFLYPALTVGCVGGVCALANVLPQDTSRLFQLYQESKHSDAKQLQHRLIEPNTGVTRLYGVPGLKQAMDWFGFYGGPSRSPLQPLGPKESDNLRKIFTDNGFSPGASSNL